MSNAIIAEAIKFLAGLILGSDTFTRVLGVIKRWDEKQIDGLEKKEGVLKEFEIIGLEFVGWVANLAIELGVAHLKYVAGQAPKLTKQDVIDTVKNSVKEE